MEPAKTILAEGKFLRLIRDGRWEYADRTRAQGAVVLVAVTDKDCLILTEQYRIPLGQRVLELPAGLVGDIQGEEDEALLTAADRELMEETGYRAGRWSWLASGPPSAGLATEVVTFYRGWDLTKIGPGGGEGSEEITVHEIPLDEIESWLAGQTQAGIAVDPKIFAGLYFIVRDSAGFGG